MPMSIAVVIPAYNAAEFISDMLESVLRQTLPADEVLVIDDGSTDDTAAIAESFGPPVRVFRRPNSRQGASRNFGVQQSKCEWIAFIDADDLWKENKLERQMQELSKHPDADVCYTGQVHFAQEGETIRFVQEVAVPPVEKLREELFCGVSFLPSSVVIRRSTFLALGGFALNFTITEDWDLWLRLYHAGTKFVSCPEPLLLYRQHQQNVSSNGMVLLQENTDVYRRLVLPHISRSARSMSLARFFSVNKAGAAYELRKKGDPRYLSMMIMSLVHWPFNDTHRYKVLAHMLYTRLKGLTRKAAASRRAN
jgi:glycosyltransferase involved in cell wall biosynthesis